MDKKKRMQLAVRILKQSSYYVKNKQSHFSNRFDLTYNKELGEINVFNAEKNDDTFFWSDFCQSVATALELSYYVHIDTYGTRKLCYHIG